MEEVKKEMPEVQAEQAAEAVQAAPMTGEEKKTAGSNFKRNVLIMASGFVLGYILGRMIFTEVRVLAYVTGMALSGVVSAMYIKK